MHRITEKIFHGLYILLCVFSIFILYTGLKKDALYANKNSNFDKKTFYRNIQSHAKTDTSKELLKKMTSPNPADLTINYKKLRKGYYSRLCGFTKNGKYQAVVGDTRFKEIALTFDIGNFSAGRYILDILKKENVKATMFLANNQSYKLLSEKDGKKTFLRTLEETKDFKEFRNLLIRMHREGHEVGNHTWSHHNWLKGVDVGQKPFTVTKELLHKELQRVNQRYKEVTGYSLAPIWRSPFGACNLRIVQWAEEAGYQHIFWTHGLDSLDWMNIFSKTDTLASLKKNSIPGGVVLFHLGNALRTRSDKIHTSLRKYIQWLKRNGYRIVTITQLLDNKINSPVAAPPEN